MSMRTLTRLMVTVAAIVLQMLCLAFPWYGKEWRDGQWLIEEVTDMLAGDTLWLTIVGMCVVVMLITWKRSLRWLVICLAIMVVGYLSIPATMWFEKTPDAQHGLVILQAWMACGVALAVSVIGFLFGQRPSEPLAMKS